MKKSELQQRTDSAVNGTREALQTLWDNIVHGQQKQLVKVEAVKAILDRYGVQYDG